MATLRTIRMVEETLQKAPHSTTTKAELKTLLPRQVQNDTLKEILEYLEESKKIRFTSKGIVYIFVPDTIFETKNFRQVAHDILKERITKKTRAPHKKIRTTITKSTTTHTR